MSWDDLIAPDETAPHTLDWPVCLDRRLVKAVTDAQAALATARITDATADPRRGAAHRPATLDAEQALADAQSALEAGQTILTLRSIPSPEWRALKVQHPPTSEQRKKGYDSHPDKFPQAAVARCLVKVTHRGKVMDGPAPTSWVEDHLRANLTDGEWDQLTNLCGAMNTGATDVGKLVGATGSHPLSGQSSTTAPPEESPTPSS